MHFSGSEHFMWHDMVNDVQSACTGMVGESETVLVPYREVGRRCDVTQNYMTTLFLLIVVGLAYC